MFGAYARAAVTIGVAVLSAAILRFVMPYLLPLVAETGVEQTDQTMLYRALAAVTGNALLIMLAAIAAGVLARAVVESNLRGGV